MKKTKLIFDLALAIDQELKACGYNMKIQIIWRDGVIFVNGRVRSYHHKQVILSKVIKKAGGAEIRDDVIVD